MLCGSNRNQVGLGPHRFAVPEPWQFCEFVSRVVRQYLYLWRWYKTLFELSCTKTNCPKDYPACLQHQFRPSSCPGKCKLRNVEIGTQQVLFAKGLVLFPQKMANQKMFPGFMGRQWTIVWFFVVWIWWTILRIEHHLFPRLPRHNLRTCGMVCPSFGRNKTSNISNDLGWQCSRSWLQINMICIWGRPPHGSR